MDKLKKLIDLIPSIKGLARLTLEGRSVETVGSIDAEATGAMALAGTRALVPTARAFGLGELRGWCVSTSRTAFYAAFSPNDLYVGVGGESKKTEMYLRNIVRQVT